MEHRADQRLDYATPRPRIRRSYAVVTIRLTIYVVAGFGFAACAIALWRLDRDEVASIGSAFFAVFMFWRLRMVWKKWQRGR